MSKILQEKISLLPSHAKGPAVVHLIREAIEHPQIFVFGELLTLPNVTALSESPEYEPWLKLLELFAFGTYKDYLESANNLPQLTPTMLAKLRSLTIISLAAKYKRISYSVLLSVLGLTNVRELEDLIIEIIYIKAIEGKMDQKRHSLEVESSISRDIKPEQLDTIAAILTSWCENCDNVLVNIEAEINSANKLKTENFSKRQELENQIAKVKSTVKTSAGNEYADEESTLTTPSYKSENFFERMKRSATRSIRQKQPLTFVKNSK